MPLNEAETKFFSSRGADVDPSLTAAPESTPAPEPESTAAVPPESAKAPAPESAAPAPAPAPAPLETPPQVPIAALHEERRRRAEADARFQQLQEQFAQLQNQIRQAQAPQPPDPDEDPVGALRYQNEQLQAQLQQVNEWRAQQERERQQQAAHLTLTQRVAAAEQAFRARTPDYDEAAKFALEAEDRRLQAFYPDPGQRAQALQQEAANVLAQAVQQGRDPAEVLYTMAKNMGYGVAPTVASPPPVAAATAPAPAPTPAPSNVVETIQRGLKQQTVGAVGGSTPPSEMTPEMLASLSGPEFQKGWAKMFGRR